jgi:hypothetical protein
MEEGSPMVDRGGTQRHTFTAKPSGTRWYHSHDVAGKDLTRSLYSGMYGFLVVEPVDDPGRYDQEVLLAAHHWEGTWVSMQDIRKGPPPDNGLEVMYASASFNDKMLGHGEPIHVREGQRVLFRLLNASPTQNVTLALPGHRLTVITLDGNSVPSRQSVDTLFLAPACRRDRRDEPARCLDSRGDQGRGSEDGPAPARPWPGFPRSVAAPRRPREVADRGGAVVSQTVSAMAWIEESSRKIFDIISVIDEIAQQTNLLALNAAVEAGARRRGRPRLRGRSVRGAQPGAALVAGGEGHQGLITNSSGQVQEGVELVNKAGGALTEIVESIKKVAQIVAEIASASAEQSTGIDQVNTALTQMDEVTQQNSALVEENASAAKSLEAQAQGMDERVSFFKLGDGAAVGAPSRVVVALASKRPAAPAPKRAPAATKGGPVGRMQAGLAVAVKKSADWKEF